MIERYAELRRIIEERKMNWDMALPKDEAEEFDALRRLLPIQVRLEILAYLRDGDTNEQIIERMRRPEAVRDAEIKQKYRDYEATRRARAAAIRGEQ